MKLRSLWRKRKDVMEFNEKEKTSAVKQQALQALHDENRRLGLYDGVYAIDVLEQENRLLRARNERLEKELKQEQGEPVAWADYGVLNWIADKQFKHAALLYTTPQQRTWVGLTDEEILNLWQKTWHKDSRMIYDFARAIEAAQGIGEKK